MAKALLAPDPTIEDGVAVALAAAVVATAETLVVGATVATVTGEVAAVVALV